MSAGDLILPEQYEIERELREQLGSRVGQQRCLVGGHELLLVLHEVPVAGIAERKAIYFWRQYSGQWVQQGGEGLSELQLLLDSYAEAIGSHQKSLMSDSGHHNLRSLLRNTGVLIRSLQDLVQALREAIVQEPDDVEVRDLSDRARELELILNLLREEVDQGVIFAQTEALMHHAEEAEKTNQYLWKLNLMVGIFLPLISLGTLLSINVGMSDFLKGGLFVFFILVLSVGGYFVWMAKRQKQ